MSIKNQSQQQKATLFYDVVTPFFAAHFPQKYGLVEFCAGNGNAGRIFQERGMISQVTLVDVKGVRGLENTVQGMDEVTVDFRGLDSYLLSSDLSIAVIAIHACSILTDKVLEKAVGANIPVAVMPCCYNDKIKKYQLQEPPNPRFLLYQRPEDYYDAVRLQFLKEAGYRAYNRTIDARITPMNTILIGIPGNC